MRCGLAIWAVGAQRPEGPWINSPQENLETFWRDCLIGHSIAGVTLQLIIGLAIGISGYPKRRRQPKKEYLYWDSSSIRIGPGQKVQAYSLVLFSIQDNQTCH